MTNCFRITDWKLLQSIILESDECVQELQVNWQDTNEPIVELINPEEEK